MRDVHPAMHAALMAARNTGIVPRRWVWFVGRDRATGAAREAGLWSGDDPLAVTLMSAATGEGVTRTYQGGGQLLTVSGIPRRADLTVRAITVSLSQIAPAAQLLVRGYDLRLGKIEVHEGLLDTVSRQLVAPPALVYYGEVQRAPVRTPAAGSKGDIALEVVPDTVSMLTRKNPAKSSYEAQKQRGGDEWGLYDNSVATWTIPWGQKA